MRALYRKQNPYSLSDNRRYHNLRRTAAVILLVTIAFTNVLSEGSVQKSASEKFTNNKNSDVDELLWKFGTPESKKETYWMESSDTWEHDEDCCRQGYCEYDENSKGKAWRGRMRAYDCHLHPDHSTTVQATAEVNKDCSFCLYEVEAKYDSGSGSGSGLSLFALDNGGEMVVPDHAFRYDPNMIMDTENYTHTSTYIFENMDPNVTITLSNIDVYIGMRWYNPTEQRQYLDPNEPLPPFDFPHYSFLGPYTIGPNDSCSFEIPDIPDSPDSFIYVAGEMTYQIPLDPNEVLVEYIHGHEEVMPGLEADINKDGSVNLWDFALMANAWLVDYNEPPL